MRLWNPIKRFFRDPRSNYEFTKEDSAAGVELRRLKKQQREMNLKRQILEQETANARLEIEMHEIRDQLDEIKNGGDDSSDDSSPMDMAAMMLLQNLMKGGQANVPTNPMQGTAQVFSDGQPMQADLSQQDIKSIVDQFPRSIIKKASKLPEETLRSLIIAHLPNLNERSVGDIILEVKGR